MFGTCRLILAALVALSHFGVHYAGFNPGQWAVISFYTLSGLLMERQFRKLGGAGNFYLDRLLRIYPVYLTVLLLTISGCQLSWVGKLANITLFPLNYSYFTSIPILIGPAWSLACEVHFYLLVPLLTLCATSTLRIVLLSSLSLFVVSPFLPHSTFWAYTGLPGILFTFVSGMLINRKDFLFIKRLWVGTAFLFAAFSASKLFRSGLPTGIHINVSLGYLTAVVVITYLDQFSPKARWDQILGLFSYPLFLCHGLVGSFVQSFCAAPTPLVLLVAAMGFSIILILTIEIPFDWIRYRLRRNTGKLRPN
jgi:peptidoglycan/LPS O-acetylase OafA/YrhL